MIVLNAFNTLEYMVMLSCDLMITLWESDVITDTMPEIIMIGVFSRSKFSVFVVLNL